MTPPIPGIVASSYHNPGGGGGPPNLLAIGSPAHAYWSEGPEFAALSLGDGAAVATWPDEVGTADLTQGTAGSRPAYDADGLGGKPAVWFQTDYMQTAAFAAGLGTPNGVACIFKFTTVPTGNAVVYDGIEVASRHTLLRLGGAYWHYAGAGAFSGGAMDNTNPHLSVGSFGNPGSLYVDGSTVVNAQNVGTHGITGLTLGADYSGVANKPAGIEIAFLGIYDTPLDSTARAALLAAAQSWYGTP